MSRLNWEADRKKTNNRLRGTQPAYEYEPSNEEFICVARDGEVSPEYHNNLLRIEELLRHLKSYGYSKKSTEKQMRIIRELHSLHTTLVENDGGYYGSTTFRRTRKILESHMLWLEKNAAGYVFF